MDFAFSLGDMRKISYLCRVEKNIVMKTLKIYSILMMTAILLTSTSCVSEKLEPTPCPNTPIASTSFKASTQMAFPLLAKVDSFAKPNENICISPISLSEALAMIANGANGNTLRQITNVVGTPDESIEKVSEVFGTLNKYLATADESSSVTLANSIWIDESIKVKDDFTDKNKELLSAETINQELASYETKNNINSWCEQKTNGNIKEFLKEPLSENDDIVLINTLHFKARWKDEFSKKKTKEADFTNYDGSKSKVMMMNMCLEGLACPGKKMDMAIFPYSNGTFCMEVFLPHEGENLDSCLANFTAENVEKMEKWATEFDEVNVSMPRMELKCETNFNEPLKAIGMTEAFSQKADFSGISDDGGKISEVKQATTIKIDEEGTEASAVTIEKCCTLSAIMEPRTLEFNMNRPFAYIIREKVSGTILFMGKVRKL